MKDGDQMKNVDFNKYKAAILGLIVGDALGVPAEFNPRSNMKDNPVTDMIGYGTHNQPAGTWSDDSSMVIATMEWLGEMKDNQLDYTLLMDKFSNWLMHGGYTPYGEVFDCGISTSRAFINYGKGMDPLECGGKSEWENGNGSLMRILPAALHWAKGLATDHMDGKEFICDLSALTHGHLRSKMGCLIYSKLIADLLCNTEKDKIEIAKKSVDICKKYFDSSHEEVRSEKEKYGRLWNVPVFANLVEDEIRSSGYIVDTLEAAIWCFLNTDNYKDCVLKAVNLGEDTDTVGAVAGGLAGLHYGMETIPEEWIDLLPKKEWIMELIEKM
jgi:ADP-ribosylglycohydrolase